MRFSLLFFILQLASTCVSGAPLNWTAVNPGPVGNPVGPVIWTGSRFIAAGAQGNLLNSKDGVIWHGSDQIKDVDGNVVIASQIVSSGKDLVAASNAFGVVWHSRDGISWERISLGFSARFSKLIWTGQNFAGLGMIGEAMTGGSRTHYTLGSSPDGTHWTKNAIGITGRIGINDLTWTGQRYLIVGTRRTNWNDWLYYLDALCMSMVFHPTSQTFVANSTDGINWNLNVLDDSEKPEIPVSIVWTGTKALVVGMNGSTFSSSDGIAWIRGKDISGMAAGSDIQSAIWGKDAFVIVGDISASNDPSHRPAILSSPDGDTWEFHVLPPSRFKQIFFATWTGSQYLIAGTGGLVESSANLENWTTLAPIGNTKVLSKIASNRTTLVAVGDNSVLTSNDGESWSLSSPSDFNAESLTWTGTNFVVVGKGGSVFTSPDAKEWAARKIESVPWLRDVAWNGSLLVAVGSEQFGRGLVIETSSDGMDWHQEQVPEGLLGSLYGVTWAGAQFVAVGDDSAIITSQDGHSWKKIQGQAYMPLLYSVASSGRCLVAVGIGIPSPNGFTSTDGQTWIPITVPFVQTLYGVAWCGDQFVAVGENGTILTSKDGAKWDRGPLPPRGNLRGVIWSGKKIFIVGDEGLVLVAPVNAP
jgi:hypothetical protein